MTFPKVNPKQSFPKLEEEVLKYWKENDIFKASIETRKDCEEFKFYDGPPFATGTPHYGHLVGGTIKDVIPRYQTMKGKKVERNFGWDCHGLPIENIVEKKLEISGKDDIESKIGVYNFNETCRANVFGYVDEWKKTVERMGRWVDMENDYKTMDTNFMESVWWVYKTIYDKGLIYEGHRVVPYCPRCSTPLSNFEVNQGYKDKQSKTVTVKFKVKGSENKYILAWTTTPWTLYANLGLAVGADIDYVELLDKTNGDTYILAREKVKDYYKSSKETGLNSERPVSQEFEILREYKGACLVGIKYEPVFPDFDIQVNEMGKNLGTNVGFGKNTYSVVLGHHVTTETGTGIVHIAPAYGEDDNIIGEKEDLGFFVHIDDSGKTYNLLDKNGMSISDFNEEVLLELKERKIALHIATINHSYPHCWRCETPLIYRAISAWYVAVEKIREKMLANNAKIHWVPEIIKEGRFGKWLEGARDWNISRNRYWGSAIPVWQSKDKKEEVCIGSIEELYQKNRDFGQITKVILVRHGRSDYNEKNLMDYQNKAKLSDLGKKQAEEIKEKLKGIDIDCIFSSPLDRCIDTIRPLAKEKSLEIKTADTLREIISPDLQDKEFSCKNYKWENRYGGGETIKEVYVRVETELKKIIDENKGKTIVICSHGDPLVLMRKVFEDYDYDTEKYGNDRFLENNPKYGVEKMFSINYVYSNTYQLVDLHKHFVDEIFIKGKENLEVKNVLGIHGFLRTENVIDFIGGTKINLEKEGINFDAPKFEIGEKIDYKNWEKKLDEIGLEKYDTIVAHSMGGRVAMEYIIEHKIKLEKLILVSSTKKGSGLKETTEFFSVMKHDNLKEINNYVKEIILIISKDDTTTRIEGAKELAKEINVNLVKLDGYGHFNVKECKVIEDIIKNGVPLKNNFEEKNVLGIHGQGCGSTLNFWSKLKSNLRQNNINLDVPDFPNNLDTCYLDWESKFNEINFKKYDTIIGHSLGSRYIIKYLIDNNIKVKKLVLVSIRYELIGLDDKELEEVYSGIDENVSKLQDLVDEIIIIHSKDDPYIPIEQARLFKKNLNISLLEVNGYGHFIGDDYPILEGIIKNGAPLQRIPEVLDCWFESGAMPYASKHYPFENSEKFKFPADFIAEGLDQTRGWFYTLLILGTALFDNTPFLNCIVNGIVLAEDGKKMSKRLNNYPEPEIIFNKYGADAMRFYLMNSPVVEAQDLRFSEAGVEEVVKKVILPLWNTYSFFTTYANIDNWTQKKGNIYYCRHGQTDNNKNNIMNGGDENDPLNEKGREQAHEAGKNFALKNEKIDIIISSHLSRAYDTAKIIAEEIGYTGEIIQDKRLRDQDSGVLRGKSREELKKEFNLKNDTEFRKFFRDKNNNQVESVKEFEQRVLQAFEEIQEKYKGKNILIIGHTGTIRPIIKKLDNLTDEEAYYENGSIPNATIIKLPTSGRHNVLDKWILGELHSLIKEVEQGMDNYKIADATRPIIKFMDNLTNWYIRRSRKRFWKSENDNDKLQAYETLYEVLITLCRVIAQFMPFVSEHIYRNLTGKKSIHLDTFPKSVNIFINEDINSQFDKTAHLVNLGLAWRQRNNLRVRQPLLSATIGEKLENYYIDILKEELNVKEVIVLDNPDKIAKKICKPNARLIGPKFGQDVKFIISEAKSGNFEEIEDGKVKVGNFILEKDEYEIAFEAGETSFDIEAGFGMVIALDKNLTHELVEEGIARDIVRQVQEARKEANFEVDDRIKLSLSGEGLENILKNFGEYIQNETLSTLVKNIENPNIEKEIEIEEKEIKIGLKK